MSCKLLPALKWICVEQLLISDVGLRTTGLQEGHVEIILSARKTENKTKLDFCIHYEC